MLPHLDDVRSDLSVFHRVDELESLAAPRFFAYARRLSTYDGAVRATALAQDRPEHSHETAEYRPRQGTPVAADPAALSRSVGSGWEDAPGVTPAFAQGMPSVADLGL